MGRRIIANALDQSGIVMCGPNDGHNKPLDWRMTMGRTTISNSDDVIDSRDVIARMEELQDERDALKDAVDEWEAERLDQDADDIVDPTEAALIAGHMANPEDRGPMAPLVDWWLENCEDYRDLVDALAEWDGDNADELTALVELDKEGSDVAGDWTHGETLVRYSYWVDYCQELCEDVGDLPKNIPSYIEIDWEATAKNLAQDYSTIEWDGVEYYVRSC